MEQLTEKDIRKQITEDDDFNIISDAGVDQIVKCYLEVQTAPESSIIQENLMLSLLLNTYLAAKVNSMQEQVSSMEKQIKENTDKITALQSEGQLYK